MKLLDKCNKHSNFLQALFALLLVVVTIFYAHSSWKMTNIMKNEFEYSHRPFVGIINETHLRKGYQFEFIPKLANGGNSTAEIVGIETDISNSKYLFGSIILLPNQERTISLAINKPHQDEDLLFKVKIIYRDLISQKEYCILYDYEIDGGFPEKVYLKSSEYCNLNINDTNKNMTFTTSDIIQLCLVIVTFFAVIVALGIEIWRRISDKRSNDKRIKTILKTIQKEIEEGIIRCELLVELINKEAISFSRIYNVLWDAARLEICRNIRDLDLLQSLHQIYYRFDLINFNMEREEFAKGAAFAKQYLVEIKENYKKIKEKLN